MKKILLVVMAVVFLLIAGTVFGAGGENVEMNGKFEVGVIPETQVVDAELEVDVILRGIHLEHVFSVEVRSSVEQDFSGEGSLHSGKYEFGYLIDYDHLFIGTGVVIYPEDAQAKIRAGIRW